MRQYWDTAINDTNLYHKILQEFKIFARENYEYAEFIVELFFNEYKDLLVSKPLLSIFITFLFI